MINSTTGKQRSKAVKKREISPSDIAIIGLACKFPDAHNYDKFWMNLKRGVNSIKVIPKTRWDIKKYYSDDPRKQNKTLSKWGGLVDGERLFDNRFFNISPREAKNMDPQQRMLLEETWHCIEDSGVPLRNLRKGHTACYVGVMATDYYQEAWSSDIIVDSYAGLGNYDCILANRLSYFFGFTGVSMAVDAACASSLVAIHEARHSLVMGESDYAFAAGVNLTVQPWKYISFSKSRMLSPEGKCKTFDKDANGYVPGEGAGIILLQRLEDAIRDNNHIYGLIIGSAVNHGGQTKSITAPAVGAQQAVISKAHTDAGINPFTLTYIEAHGTGTSLGDPVEVEALTKAFREYIPFELSKKVYSSELLAKCHDNNLHFIKSLYSENTFRKTVCLKKNITDEEKKRLQDILEKINFTHPRDNQFCKIGSVKTNIGHLEAAAGIAGIIKIILMMKHREIPPTLNVKTLNPIINFPKTPFEVALKNSPWYPAKEGLPLRAGVSSFGFGGVNSHAIVEEYITPRKRKNTRETKGKKLFVLSAKSPKSLNDLLFNWQKFAGSKEFEQKSLDDMCKTLLLGREDLTYRVGTIVNNKKQIGTFLANNDITVYRNNNQKYCLCIGNILWNGADQCGFMFEEGNLFVSKLDSVMGECFDDDERTILSSEIKSASWSESVEMKDIFPFITGYVFISVLQDCGMVFDVVTGEGNGFILALVLSGMITLQDAVDVVLQRKKWSRIKLNRPKIPFYDHVNKKTIMPFDFDDAYLALMVFEMGRKNKLFGQILVDGIFYTAKEKSSVDETAHKQETQLGKILIGMGAINEQQLEETLAIQKNSGSDPLGELLVMNKYCKHKELKEALRQQDILRYFVNDVLDHYVKAAQMLFQPGQNTGQKTFENYLEEWNIILKKYGRDIKELLYDEALFTAKKGRLKREKLLLMIILVSSFRRLNKKWNLTEEILIGEKRFYEIVDLVDDGVIPKESLVELFVSENPKYKQIAKICNSRQQMMKKSRPYLYIRKQNPNVREIRDMNAWAESAMNSEQSKPDDSLAFNPVQNYTFTQFGSFVSTFEHDHVISITTENSLEDSFNESLLYLWLNGTQIQWDKLIDESSFRKVVLPLYSFDRKPFWLERNRELVREAEEELYYESATNSKLKQLDPPYGRQYTRHYSRSDSIVWDHTITKHRLVPGAGLIEMGLEAAQKGTRKDLRILTEVFIVNPAPVEDTLDVYVEIDLHESQFSIKAKNQQICKGQYESTPLGKVPAINIADFFSSDPSEYPHLYQSFADIGYLYGINLQVISKIWEDGGKYLFQLDEIIHDEGTYTHLSPYLLDGIFQTALTILNLKQLFDDDIMYIPYYMKKMSLYGELTDTCYVYINENDMRHKGDDLFVHFGIYDSGGKMICDIRDMVYKRVNRDFLAPGMHSFAGELHTYTPAWKSQELYHEVRDVSTRLALIFADSTGLYKSLAEELMIHYKIVILVLPGDKYKKGVTYVINPGEEEDYQRLMADVAVEYMNKYKGCDVYHLWCYDQTNKLSDSVQDIYLLHQFGLKSLFALSRAAISLKIKGHVNIMVCSQNVFAVTPEDMAENYYHGGIPGFGKTLMLENPKFTIRMIDFGKDGFTQKEQAKTVFHELLSPYQDPMTAYRNKARYVHSLVPEGFAHIQKRPSWKDGGVYIMIGGAGGIGLKLVTQILKKVNATMILVGRGNLPPEKQRKLDSFHLSDREVHYYKGDVTNFSDMDRIVREVKERFGTINGVIHSGGILDDGYLMKKTWDSFCNVLSPKVEGILTLHKATLNESLDFFLVFSSIVSILGNTGQSDYASANAFLDAFVHYRNRSQAPGKSISINWTLWSDGGMGNSPEILEAFFKKSGIIDSKQAFKALTNILNNDSGQCVVAGKALVLSNTNHKFHSANNTSFIYPEANQLMHSRGGDTRINRIVKKIADTLLTLLTAIIDVEKENLDISTDLREYGMDSVTFSKFSEKINETLTTAINPTIFFEYPSVKDLAFYLEENYEFDEEVQEEKQKSGHNKGLIKEKSYSDIAFSHNVPMENNESKSQPGVKNLLLTILSEIIDINIDELDIHADVREYGMDSVGFTEFAEKINEALNTTVNPTLFFEYPSIETLYSYLMENYPELQISIDKAPGTMADDHLTSPPVDSRDNIMDITSLLVSILSEIIDVDTDDLDTGADVREYGMDSVGFTEFAEKINEALNTTVNPTLFFEYPSIETLCAYLVENYPDMRVPAAQTTVHVPQTKIPSYENQDMKIPEQTPLNAYAVKTLLVQILSGIIDVNPDDLDQSVDFREYGVDSVGFTEFAEKINESLKTTVNPTLFFEHTSIKALHDYLMDNYPDISSINLEAGDKTNSPVERVDTQMDVSAAELNKIISFRAPVNEKTTEEVFPSKSPGQHQKSKHVEFLNTESMQTGVHKHSMKDIAIIGMSGRFPGADNLDEFWNNLENKRDSVTEIPKDRWNWEDYWGDPKGNENKTNSKWGGFLRDIKRFDAKFFKISPREAELMDPQQRLLIEEVWHTLEDAGYKPSSLSGTNTGIFIGVCNDDYNELLVKHNVRMDAFTSTGSYFSILPNRISYLLNIHGPSVAIDTACSSALIAIHQAVQSIMLGDADLALAGGVNICCTPRRYISFSHAGMLTKTGKCKSFDSTADGYARGEGVGVIMLKSLEKAKEDGNHVYGIIKATAVNHGGFSTSLTAPNPNAQAQLLIKAYSKAQIDPSTVTYIEAQGTGTSLGDPIEINGLKKAFSELYKMWGKISPYEPHCGIGTAKTHIGHLESASGIAGIIKVLLSMKHKKIPGILHLDKQNPYITLEGSPFYIVDKSTDWKQLVDENNLPVPRRSGVSAFGFGGANAHIVIEEYIPEKEYVNNTAAYKYVVCLSAKTPERLFEYASNLYDRIEQDDELTLGNLAYTLHAGREVYKSRLAIVTKSMSELKELLKTFISGNRKNNNVFVGSRNATSEQLSFITTGKSGEAFVELILKNKELDKLARLWVAGFDVDWLRTYSNISSYKFISLPTYPFARDHYWVKGQEETSLVSTVAIKKKLHLLVDANESTLHEEKFTTLLHGTEFFLTDHLVGRKKMLPGVAFIEMARAAGELAGERQVKRIQNVVWMRPVIVNGQPKEIHISFYPNEIAVDFEVCSRNSDHERILHTQGKLIFEGNDTKLLIPGNIEKQTMIERCPKELTQDQCYALFESAGFSYGRGFRSLMGLHFNKYEGIAAIELPSHIYHTYDEFYLHPSLMDAAIQAVLGLILINNEGKSVRFLPFSLDELLIYARLPKQCMVYVKSKKEDTAHMKIYDVVIADNSGKILVMMNNLTLKQAGSTFSYHDQGTETGMHDDSLSDSQILDLLNKLKTGNVSTEDADKIIEGYYHL